MKKRSVGLLAVVALLAAGCSSNASKGGDSDTIKVGSLFELTGAVSAYGNAEAEAVKLAVEEINEAGGIDGKKIELVEYDIKSDEQEAASAATKLATQDNVLTIVGPATSGLTKAAIPSVTRAEVPLVSPSATDDTVTVDENGDVQPYAFRVAFQDSFQGVTLAQFAQKDLGAKKAVILGDNSSDYAIGLAKSFKDTFEGEIVSEVNFTDADSDFSAVLTKIKSMDFDVLFVPGYYEQGGPIIKQAREMGIEQPILGPDGFGNQTLVELAGEENVSDVYYTAHFSAESDKESVQDFLSRYEEAVGNAPDMFSALAYDTMYLVKDAIEAADELSAEAVTKSLEKMTDFEGVTGTFSFDEQHNPVKSAIIIELQNGKEVSATEVKP